MNKDNLIEFAKEQCEIFPEDSYMGKYLRETLKMLQAEQCVKGWNDAMDYIFPNAKKAREKESIKKKFNIVKEGSEEE